MVRAEEAVMALEEAEEGPVRVAEAAKAAEGAKALGAEEEAARAAEASKAAEGWEGHVVRAEEAVMALGEAEEGPVRVAEALRAPGEEEAARTAEALEALGGAEGHVVRVEEAVMALGKAEECPVNRYMGRIASIVKRYTSVAIPLDDPHTSSHKQREE